MSYFLLFLYQHGYFITIDIQIKHNAPWAILFYFSTIFHYNWHNEVIITTINYNGSSSYELFYLITNDLNMHICI